MNDFLNVLLEVSRDLTGLEKPDGSRNYPALSCKAIKDCYPDKQDGKPNAFDVDNV